MCHELTVDFVLLCPENRREIVCHCEIKRAPGRRRSIGLCAVDVQLRDGGMTTEMKISMSVAEEMEKGSCTDYESH